MKQQNSGNADVYYLNAEKNDKMDSQGFCGTLPVMRFGLLAYSKTSVHVLFFSVLIIIS